MNSAQIRSAVPEIFHTQTKKVTDSAKNGNEPYAVHCATTKDDKISETYVFLPNVTFGIFERLGNDCGSSMERGTLDLRIRLGGLGTVVSSPIGVRGQSPSRKQI